MAEPMELAYEERGSGPVLLFVHGFPFDRTMWIPQLSGLAKVRTCVAVDLRGHGLSADPTPQDYTMELFADDLAKTIEAIGADKVDLAGMSMGGYVVMAFWRKYRDKVRSLIFVDTKLDADSDEAKAGREKAAEAIAANGMEAFWEGLGPKLFGASPSEEVKDRAAAIARSVAPEVAASVALAMRDRADSNDLLEQIDVPVLWIHGEEDGLMPVDAARATAAKISGAKFVAIPKAGHLANMENPEAVNDAIKEFLQAQ